MGCTLAKDQVIYLCACVEVGRISWYICELFDAFSNKWNSALCLFMPSAPLTRPAGFFQFSNACRHVQWDVHYRTIRWYTCAHVRKLGEFRGTSAHFSTHFQTSETVHYAFLCLLRPSHDLQTFLNVLMQVDIFSGIYTSQGSGDILVRMCGSWENFVVHLRTFRRIFKQVKQCIMPFYAFCASHTTCRLF